VTPEEIVRAELHAWEHADIDEILSYLAPDAVWHMLELPPISGHDELRSALEGYLARGRPTEFEVLRLAVGDNLVMTERVDRWVIGGRPQDYPGMSAFDITGDKISLVREIFPRPE
jgi:limonene-1,2-epoxide hydrolase